MLRAPSWGWPGADMSEAVKDRMRKHARHLLERMKPFAPWEASLAPRMKDSICQAFGSVEGCYNQLREVATKQAEDPSPNVIIYRNGTVEYRWE